MAAFTTLNDVKARLRIDTNDDDASLDALIEAATGIVINHLKAAAKPYLDEEGKVSGDAEIPPVIQTATIILVGYLYRDPDQDPERSFDEAALPTPVRALLHPIRDPAIA